jgi:predicted small lipoprotein YifL
MKNFRALLALSLCLSFVACGDDDEPASTPTADVVADAGSTDAVVTTDTAATPDTTVTPDTAVTPDVVVPDTVVEGDAQASLEPTTYDFEGISHSGQTFRQALIGELKGWMSGLTADIDAGVFAPTSTQEVLDEVAFWVSFDGDSDGDTAVSVSVLEGLELSEKTFAEIGSANLQKKIAGNDTKTDYKDWSTEFAGWAGATSPDALLDTWFGMFAENAVARANGELDWDVHLTAQGHDLTQLVQKFLLMSVTFHQGTDDYMDHDVDGKGLKGSNVMEEGASYTGLAHAWDEGFGYFGAAKDYADYTDDEISGKGGKPDYQGHHDTNGDGMIQLKDEYNWGASVNAAKRDRGSDESAKTDFTGDIFTAFIAGRHLISTTEGELSEAQMTELMGHRDSIVWGWEKAFAATAVHYINDTLGDMATFGTEDYSFANHAKHWSELKGFSLGLQFSPHSPLSADDFAAFHEKLGDAPVLEDAGTEAIAGYQTALEEARALLGTAYGFADANVTGW